MMNRQKEWIYGKENLCDTGMRSGRDGGTRHDGIVLASGQQGHGLFRRHGEQEQWIHGHLGQRKLSGNETGACLWIWDDLKAVRTFRTAFKFSDWPPPTLRHLPPSCNPGTGQYCLIPREWHITLITKKITPPKKKRGFSQAIHIFFSGDSSVFLKREICIPLESDSVLSPDMRLLPTARQRSHSRCKRCIYSDAC